MKSPSWLTSPPRDLRSENHRVSSRCCLSEEPQHARGRTGRYLIFSASNSLCGGLLNFFLLANQSFCNTHTHTQLRIRAATRVEKRPSSLTYQAHLGLYAVQVYPRDHLQGDGVLARLHIVHLENRDVTFTLTEQLTFLRSRA